MELTTLALLSVVMQGIYTVQERELNLLILVPDPQDHLPLSYQPSYAAGPALYPAAELAADLVNGNTSILQGYGLKLLRGDSGCSLPFRAVEAFTTPILRSVYAKEARPIVGVIGPSCSLSALSISALSKRSEIALLTLPLAGTPALSDRNQHPYTLSMLDSSELLARAMASLIEVAQWKRITLFYETSRAYFSSLAQILNVQAQLLNTTLDSVGISGRELSPFQSIGNRYRIVFLPIGTDLLNRILCIAYEHDYSYPVYQYVLVVDELPRSYTPDELEAIDSVAFEVGSRPYNCTRNQIWEMLNGSILINYNLKRPDRNTVTSSGISLETFAKLYQAKLNGTDSSIYAPVFFDGVWSFILALNEARSITDLVSYSFGQENVTNLIREKLFGLDFEGLSGKIQFNRMTGRIKQNVSIYLININNGTLLTKKVADYRRDTDDIFHVPNQNTTIYINDTFDQHYLTVPKPLVYTVLVAILLAFILTSVLNVLFFVYRNVDSVKASSTKLTQVAFIGCYIHMLSMVFVVIICGYFDRIDSITICKIQQLLDFTISVGLTVLLGAICVRAWRLYRIFNHFRKPGNLLSDHYLILSIVSMVAINLVFTVPAFFVDKYKPMFEMNARDNAIVVVVGCERNRFVLWFVAGLLVSAVLLSAIFLLAFLTRKIPQKNFKTKSILYLSYSLIIVIPLLLGLYFVFSLISVNITSLILRFISVCVLLLCLILIPCAMLFFPPLLPILKHVLGRNTTSPVHH